MGHHHEPSDGCNAQDHHHDHSHHAHPHGLHDDGHAHHKHSHDDDGARLERDCGRNKLLYVDAFSGVSGDMFISALLDLGAPRAVLEEAVQCLPMRGYRLEYGHRHRSGIVGASFDVHVDDVQPDRAYADIDHMLADASLETATKDVARRIFAELARAEARVHRTSLDEVHFHEVGAVDSIVDIVGAAALLTWINPSEVVVPPLPLGHGTINVRHGVLPLPAPASLECLCGLPVCAVDVEGELVTPTGAAIVRAIATSFGAWPSMVPERIGFGSGSREWKNVPNLLRLVLASRFDQTSSRGVASHCVLETNLDDITGELAAHAISSLMEQGALDVWATPTTTKKGRPGLVLSVLVAHEHAARLEQCLLAETTSIGVRSYAVSRTVRPRTIIPVQTSFGEVPIKISGGGYGPDQAKPEFDVCVSLAADAKVPVRDVLNAALVAYWTSHDTKRS